LHPVESSRFRDAPTTAVRFNRRHKYRKYSRKNVTLNDRKQNGELI
jgi:hypothetical protein